MEEHGVECVAFFHAGRHALMSTVSTQNCQARQRCQIVVARHRLSPVSFWLLKRAVDECMELRRRQGPTPASSEEVSSTYSLMSTE